MARTQSNRKPESSSQPSSSQSTKTRVADIAAEVRSQLGEAWIPAIYWDKVLSQRTRQYELKASTSSPRIEILHTLLGIELQVGRRRLLCPDLATARYLSVFARLGCETIAVPYDITKVSRLADELESSWHRMLLLGDHLSAGRGERFRRLVRSRILSDARDRVHELGSGAKFPQFNQETRQRRR